MILNLTLTFTPREKGIYKKRKDDTIGSFDSFSCIPIQNNPNATEKKSAINLDIIFFFSFQSFNL